MPFSYGLMPIQITLNGAEFDIATYNLQTSLNVAWSETFLNFLIIFIVQSITALLIAFELMSALETSMYSLGLSTILLILVKVLSSIMIVM